MQNTITEMKNSLEETNSRIQGTEPISEVQNRLREITEEEKKREKKIEKK